MGSYASKIKNLNIFKISCWGNSYGVVNNELDIDIVVSEFELHLLELP